MGIAIASGGLAGLNVSDAISQPLVRLAENIPTTTLGRSGLKTKILGFGTYFFCGEEGGGIPGGLSFEESDLLINTALDLGINFFDTARWYGVSEGRVSRVSQNRRDEIILSGKVPVWNTTKEDMLRAIETSLLTLKTDHMDLYMMHDVSKIGDYNEAVNNGFLDGLIQAKKEGKTRFIGLTTHDVWSAMTAMRSGEFDFCEMPYNPVTREFGRAMNLARKLNVATIIMKPLMFGGLHHYNPKNPGELNETITIEESLRFSFSHPGTNVVIPGQATLEYLMENAAIAATFKPLTPEEYKEIVARAERIAGGVCSVCEKPCESVCPNEVPISYLMPIQSLMRRYRRGIGQSGRYRKEHYQALTLDGRGHDYLDCDGCGECEKVCPQKFKIRDEMRSMHNSYAT